MHSTNSAPWYVSLHGGHTAEFCDHGTGDLRAVLEAAVAKGFSTYGVSEHAARVEERFLYPNERCLGWTIEKVQEDFERYGKAIFELAEEFAGRLTVLRGMEAEVVPANRYADIMLAYRERFAFDYLVGSVHYVDEMSIDDTPDQFEEAMEAHGGLERLAVRYYETVGAMVDALRPDVVGHLDVIRTIGWKYGDLASPAIRRAAGDALDSVRRQNCILDLNTAGYRKGLHTPYPDVWLVERARDMKIPFALGDDCHGPEDVGAEFEQGRAYLLANGVETVTVLQRDGNRVERRTVPL